MAITQSDYKLSQPYHRNPRQTTPARLKKLDSTLTKYGDLSGVVHNVRNGQIIGGNQRTVIFKDSSFVEIVEKYDQPDAQGTVALGYIVYRGAKYSYRQVDWDEATESAANLIANTDAGTWDFDIAANQWDAAELMEYAGWGEDLLKETRTLGSALDNFIRAEQPEPVDAEPQIDRAEELREKWGVEAGDLWILGDHRLICGDCTDAAVVARVMGGERSQMCFTSPPYNAGLSARTRGNKNIVDSFYFNEYKDNKASDNYLGLLRDFTKNALDFCDYIFVNIQVLAGNKKAFIQYWSEYAGKFADVAVWDKRHAQPSQAKRVMDSRFEFVLIFGGNGSRAVGTRDFRGTVQNVYDGSPQRQNENADIHAATFPVDLPEYFIKTFTNNGEVIFEPFCGTGTTLIACENLSRKCRAIEISPAYCAVALERYFQATGKTPAKQND